MHKYISLLFLSVLLFACGPEKGTSDALPVSHDTIKMLDAPPMPAGRIDSIDLASVLEKKLALWIRFCKSTDPLFELHGFSKPFSVGFQAELEDSDSGRIDKDMLKYFYIPSSGNQTLLDIYSYRCMMDWDSVAHMPHIEGGDPESTIEILDTKKHIRKRILMVGSEEGFDDACWITKDIFLVTGSRRDSAEAWQPTYYLYDLKEQRCILGEWPAHKIIKEENYLRYWKGKSWKVKWE